MENRSSIFDMIGPVMIGPSSSHTAGAARIGRVARKILGIAPESVIITFYNSFATTYEGHGSDRAVLAGLMDWDTDDDRIRNALTLAHESGIEYSFKPMTASTLHPNSIRIVAKALNKTVEILGISRGGGLITIAEVDGFRANFNAQLHTLLITADDIKGSIAFITSLIAHDDCNIATMTVTRKAKNSDAKLILEMDSNLKDLTIEYLRSLRWVHEVIYLPPLS